jgi:hypothetical protein
MSDIDNAFNLILKNITVAAENTIVKASELAIKEARATKLFKHGAKFDEQIQYHSINSTSGEVVSGAPYSGWLEFGNDPGGGYIYPKTANKLRFFANGNIVFANRVRAHKPFPFFNNAAKVVSRSLTDIFNSEFRKL